MNKLMTKQAVSNQNSRRFCRRCRFTRQDSLRELDFRNRRAAQCCSNYQLWGCEDSCRVTVAADHKGENTEILQANRMISVRKVV